MAINNGQTLMFNGLGTLTFPAVPNAGTYQVKVKSSLPQRVDGNVSQLVIDIKKGGVSQVASVAGSTGDEANLQLAAGDVITVVFSSAASVDSGLNVIKSVCSLGQVEL